MTHSNISTTQIYAEVIDELKRNAAERITLKDDSSNKADSNEQ